MIRQIKQFLPRTVKKRIRILTNYIKNIGKDREYLFTEIYEKNIWGTAINDEKYFSGGGTVDANVEEYKKLIINFIREYEIKSIFEIGCGDFSIMNPIVNQLEVKYLGIDVVKSLIDYLSENYKNEETAFIHMDAVNSKVLPDADLCIIRQVLQHLNNKDIIEILNKTRKYKYVIITEHLPLNTKFKNEDKITGHTIRLDYNRVSGVFLDTPPFSLKCKILLSYRSDYATIPAVILTSLIENHQE